MLVSMKYLLDKAKDRDFAVGAFNATELALVRSVVEQAEESDSPAIIEASAGEFEFVTTTSIVEQSLLSSSFAWTSCTGILNAKIVANTNATILPIFCFFPFTRIFLSFIRFLATLLEV